MCYLIMPFDCKVNFHQIILQANSIETNFYMIFIYINLCIYIYAIYSDQINFSIKLQNLIWL